MFKADLRQADAAIAAGRLEEASELLLKPGNRNVAASGPLIDRVVEELITRGGQHLHAERFDDAMADAKIAKQLAGRQLAVTELIADIRRSQGRDLADPSDRWENDPSSFQLTIDGVGSLLVHQGEQLRIGGLKPKDPVDVRMRTLGVRSPLVLQRSGDEADLSASSDDPFRVNSRDTRDAGLIDGDTVRLSDRCRLRIRRQVPASRTVVIESKDATIDSQRDDLGICRHIVWIGESLVLGPKRSLNPLGTGAHFRVAELSQSWMIVRDQGRWAARPQRDRRRSEAAVPLSWGRPSQAGELTILITKSNLQPPASQSHDRV